MGIQNTGVSSLFSFPGELPNPGLPHCRLILRCLNHQGSPRTLAWAAGPFLQWIFPTQALSRGLLPCRRILYQLRHQGSPVGWGFRTKPRKALCPPVWSCQHTTELAEPHQLSQALVCVKSLQTHPVCTDLRGHHPDQDTQPTRHHDDHPLLPHPLTPTARTTPVFLRTLYK